jgi:hypothetical protein
MMMVIRGGKKRKIMRIMINIYTFYTFEKSIAKKYFYTFEKSIAKKYFYTFEKSIAK